MVRKERFADAPVDPDTRVLSESLMTIGGVDALHQKWNWEGILGESLPFVSRDVQTLGDAELRQLGRASLLVRDGSDLTVKRDPLGYTFVNFNFSCD